MSVPPHDGVAANVSALPGMGSTLPAPIVDRLVSIHAKLLQLVESITEFEQQILYGGNEGMMGWYAANCSTTSGRARPLMF